MFFTYFVAYYRAHSWQMGRIANELAAAWQLGLPEDRCMIRTLERFALAGCRGIQIFEPRYLVSAAHVKASIQPDDWSRL
jgi:hypothetical protein